MTRSFAWSATAKPRRTRGALAVTACQIGAIVFLGWIAMKSMLGAPAAQNYSLLGFLVIGLILMFIARFVLRSPFFSIKRESWRPE